MTSSEFSHRSSHGAKAGRRRLLAVTALVVVLTLLDLITGGTVRSLIRSATASLWAGTEHVRSSITNTGYFASRHALAEDNAALRNDNTRLREKAAAHDVLRVENEQLRAALNLARNQEGVTAPIVSSFRSSPYGSFIIGRGSNDSISAGDVVVTEGGFVLGTVSDVQEKTAAIESVFSAGKEVDARIGGTAVVVTGAGGGNAHAEVPRGVEVTEGQPVTSPSHGGRALGIVGRIESSPTSPDQKIFIRLPANLTSLHSVFVLDSR